jgi:hypothetical protein
MYIINRMNRNPQTPFNQDDVAQKIRQCQEQGDIPSTDCMIFLKSIPKGGKPTKKQTSSKKPKPTPKPTTSIKRKPKK